MPTAVEIGRWTLDPARSTVVIKHKTIWGLSTVNGAFSQVSGEGEVLPDGSAHGTLKIDAASIDTKHGKRDAHLRSAEFFDIEKHPEITFTASGATPNADGTAHVIGDLTVRGVSRPLSFNAAVNPDGEAVTLTAETAVDRAEFGLTWNQLGMIRGLATVAVSLVFTRAV